MRIAESKVRRASLPVYSRTGILACPLKPIGLGTSPITSKISVGQEKKKPPQMVERLFSAHQTHFIKVSNFALENPGASKRIR
jgi:hypothetical protein